MLLVDITDADAASIIRDTLQTQHHGVDIVVHNAGVTRDKTLARMKREYWDQAIDINLGAVVAITDCLGLQPWSTFAAHGAAKAAEIHLVKELARAWAPAGVRVCGVAPGPVDLHDDEHREATLRAAARGATERLVAPSEVGAAVRFCLENDALTGVNVIVDGGSLVTS